LAADAPSPFSRRRYTKTPAGLGIVLGRSPDCEIVLSDGSVSRLHAELLRIDDRRHLRDVGSTNGTWVNGRRLQGQLEIAPGDVLTFGNLTARL
jgi:pSer/pThr/pTyr-binding forkhead associated (FHA) protein